MQLQLPEMLLLILQRPVRTQKHEHIDRDERERYHRPAPGGHIFVLDGDEHQPSPNKFVFGELGQCSAVPRPGLDDGGDTTKVTSTVVPLLKNPAFRKPRPGGAGGGKGYPLVESVLSFFEREEGLSLRRRSSTAETISGKPTVASTKTSPNLPPSAGGTNFPHDTASLYGLPDSPPQYTGSGQMRTP